MTQQGKYRTDQQDVRCRVQTPAGWLSGLLHMPKRAALKQFLESQAGFVRMTDVTLPGTTSPIGFFALQPKAIQLIIPEDPEILLETTSTYHTATTNRTIACLVGYGVVRGTVRVQGDRRVSDYLSDKEGLLAIRQCTIHPKTSPGVTTQMVPSALVGLRWVIGIAEVERSIQ